MSAVTPLRPTPSALASKNSSQLLKDARANEMFIAIVAPAGAGAGTAANVLASYISELQASGMQFEVVRIKASDVIRDWAQSEKKEVPEASSRKSLDSMIMMQDRGDDMRRALHDNAAVAKGIIRKIRSERVKLSGRRADEIDGKPRAYVIDSLRHPAEANLLRRLYQDAFALVGVVCDPEERKRRLIGNLFDKKNHNKLATKQQVDEFINRDANAPEKHGQHVVDTFHEADFFVDNSEYVDDVTQTKMNEPLKRFVKILGGTAIVRPDIAETAMHHAHSAQMRSACLSRQVGAALVDVNGNIVATGTNEVPRAGGGVYGELFRAPGLEDGRCAYQKDVVCSNNTQQNEIIAELLVAFPELLKEKDKAEVTKRIRATRLGGLIEFSRAVHAEMDAILSAARTGVSPVGTRLFVSAFPCHYCARHIVSAGIDEVQYIEPYPKSKALALHDDAITVSSTEWMPPSTTDGTLGGGKNKSAKPRRVLFRPFVGVAPRMYRKAFIKDRDYKNSVTGKLEMGTPEWGREAEQFAVHYTSLEERLAGDAA